ncbi:MAG: alpha/beta hydrolase [Akkermansiaceae bacterium]|nr:alpha/beta hydrolase [Akkermansiaceae bacterium]
MLLAFCAWACTGCSLHKENPEAVAKTSSNTSKALTDVVFASPGGVDLLLDLHLPETSTPAPLVVYIHGGGWSSGNRKSHGMSWLNHHGYAVACIEYRMGREAPFPAQIHDCKGALRWLRAHQDTYGYDASKVVVAGMSAGGHLATLMGTTNGDQALEGTTAGHPGQSSRIQGVINYFGPSDFILRSKNQPDKTERRSGPVFQLLGGPVKSNLDPARLASPVTHISEGDPPLLILHGSEDRQVLLNQSQHLLERYQAQGLKAQLHVENGAGHGWIHPTSSERKVVLKFLGEILR